LIKDTGSPPFVVHGNINIGGESNDVKGLAAADGRPGDACEAAFGDIG
jgi:hypothetical protein